MIGNRKCAVALAAVFTLSSFAALAKSAPFDGSWNMVLMTTNGHCGVINMGMAVNGGHISATSGKFVMHKIFLARAHFRLWPDQDQRRGRPAPGQGDRKVHEGQGRRQVERHRALRRLLWRLDRRPRLTPFTASDTP